MKIYKNQNGFSVVELLFVFIIVITVVAIGYHVAKRNPIHAGSDCVYANASDVATGTCLPKADYTTPYGQAKKVDDPSQGIHYDPTLASPDTGPCAGEQAIVINKNSIKTLACTHPDPGPAGVDVRVRNNQVDATLAAQAASDGQNPQAGDTLDASTTDPNDIGGSNTPALSSITPKKWPCVGNNADGTGPGTDGSRVQEIYAHPVGSVSRVKTLHPYFDGIVRRMNRIVYASGRASGDARQLRLVTDSACHTVIKTVAIKGAITDFGNITSQLSRAGYSHDGRIYLVWVDDKTSDKTCGQGSLFPDASPGQDNLNNLGGNYAIIWHPCWDYAEPHEFGHTLGAVQTGAPHATKGSHCTDQHDIMCYKDAPGVITHVACTAKVYYWRYDCDFNTYFKAKDATGWLGKHWNTANSQFLFPNPQSEVTDPA